MTLDLDDAEGVPSVYLEQYDLRHLHGFPGPDTEKPVELTREFFLQYLAMLIDAGWTLKHPASWRPRSHERLPREKFDEVFFEKMNEEAREEE